MLNMPISARAVVDLILLGPTGDRRQLQDSPILGDVWLAFAARPGERTDLLITAYRGNPAGPVAKKIANALRDPRRPYQGADEALVAYLQGFVAARLSFRELLRVIVPRTFWWKERRMQEKLSDSVTEERLVKNLKQVILWAREPKEDKRIALALELAKLSSLDRYITLAGIILWAGESAPASGGLDKLARLGRYSAIVKTLRDLWSEIREEVVPPNEQGIIWQISLNRKAMPALQRSVPAVKGDAARSLFKVKCDEIRWAVLDSGIDGNHPAFRGVPSGSANAAGPGELRVIKAYDFRNIRKIVSLDNEDIDKPALRSRLEELLGGRKLKRKEAISDLKLLARDAENDRPIYWELVEKFIAVDPTDPPAGPHGTHVACIIGARGTDEEGDGMCPDIKLLDFRVLGKTLGDTEFAIIAALQFIRYLNERNGYIAVHGANLSLSIPHDVRNFACGRTPICKECERLVDSGVVIVGAAGNLGYQSFETKEGVFDTYAAFSITDPGNADGVITVGATHRFWPHTYGVSFFSSRGPTGDGRLKPDIVAPGERIRSSVLNQEWGEMDGTSMAAPHVSGAAAMLMARYSELIGQPRRIKDILCESATDLGRERSFQGHGMLDVLRAFQRI